LLFLFKLISLTCEIYDLIVKIYWW